MSRTTALISQQNNVKLHQLAHEPERYHNILSIILCADSGKTSTTEASVKAASSTQLRNVPPSTLSTVTTVLVIARQIFSINRIVLKEG